MIKRWENCYFGGDTR